MQHDIVNRTHLMVNRGADRPDMRLVKSKEDPKLVDAFLTIHTKAGDVVISGDSQDLAHWLEVQADRIRHGEWELLAGPEAVTETTDTAEARPSSVPSGMYFDPETGRLRKLLTETAKGADRVA